MEKYPKFLFDKNVITLHCIKIKTSLVAFQFLKVELSQSHVKTFL